MPAYLMRCFKTFIAVALFASVGLALADPPSRVARLAYVSGQASFLPGGVNDWVRATINRPLVTGDRLWADRGAHVELQLGSAAVRAGPLTQLGILNLDDRTAQLELTEGALMVQVRRLDRGEVFEVDTPQLAYIVRRPGSYIVKVEPNGASTMVAARAGQAEVYGEGRSFITSERQGFRFYDTTLRDYDTFSLGAPDELERFASQRERAWQTSASRRYVSADLIGYSDLDRDGAWQRMPDYGWVWVPARVAADWAPYRDGHWAWVEPWGWTWIDDAPWGFATSHYGRWARWGNRWAWVPGPSNTRPVYAPALVAFSSVNTGGGNAVAWFPLAPREVYRPSYAASREYFTSVNVSNTAVDRSRIAGYYEQPRQAVHYVNQGVAGAVIGMLASGFAESRSVAREHVRIAPGTVSAPAFAVPPVVPRVAAVMGAAAPSAAPPKQVQTRGVVAHAAPPAPPVAFTAKQQILQQNEGKPHDAAAVTAARPQTPAASSAVPTVRIVQAASATAAPPPHPSSTGSAPREAGSMPREAGSAPREAGQSPRAAEGSRATPSAPPAPIAKPSQPVSPRAHEAPRVAPLAPQAAQPAPQAAQPAPQGAQPPAPVAPPRAREASHVAPPSPPPAPPRASEAPRAAPPSQPAPPPPAAPARVVPPAPEAPHVAPPAHETPRAAPPAPEAPRAAPPAAPPAPEAPRAAPPALEARGERPQRGAQPHESASETRRAASDRREERKP